MEESLKARLIGAAVLVALAVLLIPELLSGRKPTAPAVEEGTGPRGTRTFTIELGQAPGRAPPNAVAGSGPTPGTPVAGAPAAAEMTDAPAEPPAEPTVQTAESPEPRLEPAPAPAPVGVAAAPQPTPSARDAVPGAVPPAEPMPPPAASGGWAVQVGAFGSMDAARKVQQDLSGAGYRAFVSPVKRAGKTLYRVRVGPVGDRAGAEQLMPRLKARGLPATVVRND